MPQYKGGLKDSTKFKSYRAIAGASQLLKLFEYVILKLWGHYLTSDSLQFGFKPGVSTTQCSWLVLEVANWYVQRGGVCQAAFMDCSMAFDKCMLSKLFPKMLAKGISPIVVRISYLPMRNRRDGSVLPEGTPTPSPSRMQLGRVVS